MSFNPLESPARKRKFETYDFEWVPRTLKMRLCGRYGERGYKYYFTVDDFLNDVLTYSNRGKWFFAHAGGLADVQFIFEKLIKSQKFLVEASFSGSSAIIVKVKRYGHTWCFCDSYWLFRDSLANIGKKMGLEKSGPTLEVNMSEEETRKWYESVSLETLIPYNERDCEILYRAIYAFQELLLQEGGVLQKTIASCGMTLFRRAFLNRSIRTNEGTNNIAREAYHASRVEVLSHRCVNAKYFDINSSFPFSMCKPQPGDLIQSHRGLPDRLLQKNDRSYLVKANITVPDCHIPPIPYRQKSNNRLYFPCGEWTAWFIDIDFETLLEEGCKINAIYESKEFEVFTDLADYATTIYDKRKKETDGFMKILYKYLMNSVYGKLAERSEKKKMWINPNAETVIRLDEKYDGLENCYVRDGVFIEDIYLPLQHVHVPISARITAFSRKLLYDMLATSTESYYCDTDGFATTDDFPVGEDLGELKMEKEIIHGEFYSPKVYSLTVKKEEKEETIVHAKGFSLGKQDTPEKREEAIKRFKAIVEGKHIQVERMARIRENLRNRAEPTEKIIEKALSDNVIPKRFFYPDGESRPWQVEEIRSFS
jgi:hypothetical protein